MTMFKPKTVDSVLASFLKTIDDLVSVSVAARSASERLDEMAAHYSKRAESQANESLRATLIADRLKALVSDTK